MTEILTESFCERCGTRYTFESARPRVRLKGVKVLSRGLKNFVLSDDTSMDEAMAAARSETDREASAHQLDAFHETFNFCMTCRQYTCPNCWNDVEARCLTCAPLALPEAGAATDDLAAFREAVLMREPAPGNGTLDHVHEHEHEGWSPTGDQAPAIPVDDEGVAASEVPLAPADPTGKAAAQTAGLLRRFRPGQSLDAELDAFERERDDAAALTQTPADDAFSTGQPEPAVAGEAVFEAGVDLEAETEPEAVEPFVAAAPLVEPAVVAEPVVEPAVAAEPLVEPVDSPVPGPEIQPEPEPLAAAAAGADVVEQPTWRITAPDMPPVSVPAPGPGEDGIPMQASGMPATPADAEPQWPARPQWPGTTPTGGLPFLGRPAAPQGGIDALWAASNQELASAAPTPQGRAASGIQPCVSCGLSLSSTARFCRRCGTLQGR